MDRSDELEWAETARWIKFEEEVEEGSGRWGRPHISALTFHSLVELKNGLDKGGHDLGVGVTVGTTWPPLHLAELRVVWRWVWLPWWVPDAVFSPGCLRIAGHGERSRLHGHTHAGPE